MAHYDILTFRPDAEQSVTNKKPFPFGKRHFPGYARQGERLADRFFALQDYIAHQEVLIQEQQDGIDPDRVLVFESVGDVANIVKAIEKIPGFKFISDEALDDVDADDDFYLLGGNNERQESRLSCRLYATLTNVEATQQLLSLWNRFQAGERAHRGEAPFWYLFRQLRDVRYWSTQDRLEDTGVLEYFRNDMENGEVYSSFEIELWFYADEDKANQAESGVTALIQAAGGQVESRCRYPQIGYHALAVSCPSTVIQQIVDYGDGIFLTEQSIKFLKPIGQCVSKADMSEASETIDNYSANPEILSRKPHAAMFDGLPVENHVLLRDYLLIDDPDNYQQNYISDCRRHGTAMASLIIHDDLNKHAAAISTPLYVRPICKPNADGDETVPKNVLFPDLLHRAVVKMVGNQQCDEIRIVNLSIGNGGKMFAHTMSAEAKMLDWLSHTYHILFMISAGNHPNHLEIADMTATDFSALSEIDRLKLIYEVQMREQHRLRLLAPAESFNNLTIGSLHQDNSNTVYGTVDFIPNGYPAVYSAMGAGVGRAVKPDCVIPGGKQVYRSLDTRALYRMQQTCARRGPGQLTASPQSMASENYQYGTSNSAALATRMGLEIYELLQTIPNFNLPNELFSVAIKAMLIHSCSWGNLGQQLMSVLPPHPRKLRNDILKLIGYGQPDLSRVHYCTDERVIFVGYGAVNSGKFVSFRVPLPPCLVAQTTKKRLTLTLAWTSALSGAMNKTQKSHLYFEPSDEYKQIGTRQDSDNNASRHGTVQHEVFEGDSAASYVDGTELVVRVNRKKDDLSEALPFVLVLSLEVAEGVGLPVYQEVLERVRLQTGVRI